MRYAEFFYIVKPHDIAVRVFDVLLAKCMEFSAACKISALIHRKIAYRKLINYRVFHGNIPLAFPALRSVPPHIDDLSASAVRRHGGGIRVGALNSFTVARYRKRVENTVKITRFFVLENSVFLLHRRGKDQYVISIVKPQINILGERLPHPESRPFGRTVCA